MTSPLPTISVAIICKNEEKIIHRAINSVKEADEILILDTGSTDGTEQAVAALNLPNVTFLKDSYQWCDDFAHARNAAMSYCTGDWVLFLDCDDWMEPGAIESIRAAAAQVRPTQHTLSIRIRHETHADHQYSYPKVIRRESGVHFEGACHEWTTANHGGPDVAVMVLGRSDNHDTDTGRVLRIMGKMHEENPKDGRTLYYLAREYYYLKKWRKATDLFEQCIKHSRFLAERADAYLYLARIHWVTAKGDEARDACMKAITINANFKEALLFMATLSFEHNAVRWREFAECATNERVLFVRG